MNRFNIGINKTWSRIPLWGNNLHIVSDEKISWILWPKCLDTCVKELEIYPRLIDSTIERYSNNTHCQSNWDWKTNLITNINNLLERLKEIERFTKNNYVKNSDITDYIYFWNLSDTDKINRILEIKNRLIEISNKYK